MEEFKKTTNIHIFFMCLSFLFGQIISVKDYPCRKKQRGTPTNSLTLEDKIFNLFKIVHWETTNSGPHLTIFTFYFVLFCFYFVSFSGNYRDRESDLRPVRNSRGDGRDGFLPMSKDDTKEVLRVMSHLDDT